MTFDPWYEVRDGLVAALERDLVGPGADDEVLDEYPLERYIAGILYPRNSLPPKVEDDQIEGQVSDPEGASGDDAPVAMAHVRYPSSIGLTFAIDSRLTTELEVDVSAGRYEAVDGVEQVRPAATDDGVDADEGRPACTEEYQRIAIRPDPIKIDVSVPTVGDRTQLADGLVLYARVREPDDDGTVTVTLALVNDHRLTSGFRDEWSFFQPRIAVRAVGGASFPFIDKWSRASETDDPDLASFELLYRDVHHYATGHGCSVTWDEPGSPTSGIWTTFVPTAELLLANANPPMGGANLAMVLFAEAPKTEVLASLSALCAAYEGWIAACRLSLQNLPTDRMKETAQVHLEACEEALTRMRSGISLLDDPAQAAVWDAFRMANKAMLKQRGQAAWVASGRNDGGKRDLASHAWRPFQMAFILLCLPGIADSDSPDRGLADLLWFPTGGGKTEAYLGLIAFTIFHRRLTAASDVDGVVAIMRYTLRLLTIQQFQRATLLICACESIRKSDERLGRTPISIGLWVGGAGSPNKLSEVNSALKTLRAGGVVTEGNPVQLHACPWCGTALSSRNYYLNRDRTHLIIACKDADCEFANHLPVYVVDEEIYRVRPTLIIATVDKFANIPWKEEASQLFNLGTGAPPELIIQDELHLISGPLGTMTGLYETAIDVLCSRQGARPKVIASTATIRRAGPQAGSLFNRPVRQFPPPGLHASDSFFLVEADASERPTRRYVGLMAPGSSHTTLMIRVYAALLQSNTGDSSDEAVRDAYWTLVGYFNSLRVLGGARIAVQDDVQDRMELLATRADTDPREVPEVIEMTSREPSSEIPRHLDRMAVSLPSADTLDVILATNMISVGVDIDRLGMMAVMGQPQSSSEYIQATSRVGRQHPGLVVTILNASRSRDRSHYESFVPFHRAIYRQVEATSVTPFAPRALDRGLHAVFVALVRLLVPGMSANSGASEIVNHLEEVREVEALILDRVRQVDPQEEAHVAEQLQQIRDRWIDRAGRQGKLVYSNWKEPQRSLLVEADVPQPEAFPTLRSMRDVDQSSNLYLIG